MENIKVYDKRDEDCDHPINVYNVRDSGAGYPLFLVYEDGNWVYRSAKYYKPYRTA